jgi:hypothetical protein
MISTTNTPPTITPFAQIIFSDEILEPDTDALDAVTPLQRQLVSLIISIVTNNESSNLPSRLIGDATREFQH